MWPRFGGYWGYMAAPLRKTQRHWLEVIKRKEKEARDNAEVEAEIAEGKRAAERNAHNGRR